MSQKTVGFVLVGGEHQALHLLPSAVPLSQKEFVSIKVLVRSEEEQIYCRKLLKRLGGEHIVIEKMTVPFWIRKFAKKKISLFFNRNKIKSFDAVIASEPTSTILRSFIKKMPLFVLIPHGAGDRAKGYDSRTKIFDHVIVAGSKHRRTMIDKGLVTRETCSVAGYIKRYVIQQLNDNEWSYFPHDKPIVLYIPHFDLELSSWPKFGEDLLEFFQHQSDFNVVIAPHIRLSKSFPQPLKDRLDAIAKANDHICVDLGSPRVMDMTYTRNADIYVGDVSSQVYEFLVKPKPCIFLNSHDANWQDNPDYGHWAMGQVCNDLDEFKVSLNKAVESHPEYAEIQKSRCFDNMGDPDWVPTERAAEIIYNLLQAEA